MTITGTEHLEPLIAGRVADAKMVFNERGAVIFPATRQHRDAKAEGISYEDNYAGNALAAMLRRDAIEIRFHRAFNDAAVTRIVAALLTQPELSCVTHAKITYQGRAIATDHTSPPKDPPA
ncbi:MAG: hypothetical protein QM783_06615 [Phycisphaerales bacterium]